MLRRDLAEDVTCVIRVFYWCLVLGDDIGDKRKCGIGNRRHQIPYIQVLFWNYSFTEKS